MKYEATVIATITVERTVSVEANSAEEASAKFAESEFEITHEEALDVDYEVLCEDDFVTEEKTLFKSFEDIEITGVPNKDLTVTFQNGFTQKLSE